MIHTLPTFAKPEMGIPRESGDDPVLVPYVAVDDRYSPRERG